MGIAVKTTIMTMEKKAAKKKEAAMHVARRMGARKDSLVRRRGLRI